MRHAHDITGWYVKAGWSNKFSTLGATHFYGEYGQNDDGFDPRHRQLELWYAGQRWHAVVSTEATRYGVGVVQEIDAAAMSLWAKWRHHELDVMTRSGTEVLSPKTSTCSSLAL